MPRLRRYRREMSSTPSGDDLEPAQPRSWASESLSMALRRELLERELKKLGLPKAQPGRAARAGDAPGTPRPEHAGER